MPNQQDYQKFEFLEEQLLAVQKKLNNALQEPFAKDCHIYYMEACNRILSNYITCSVRYILFQKDGSLVDDAILTQEDEIKSYQQRLNVEISKQTLVNIQQNDDTIFNHSLLAAFEQDKHDVTILNTENIPDIEEKWRHQKGFYELLINNDLPEINSALQKYCEETVSFHTARPF